MKTQASLTSECLLLSCLLLAESAGAATLFSNDYNIAGFGQRTERIFSTEFTVEKPWTLDAVNIEVTHQYASELELSLTSPTGDVFFLLNRNGARTRVGNGSGTLAGVETYTLVESGAPLGSVSNWNFTGYRPGGIYDALEWPSGTRASGVWTIALTNVNVSGLQGGAVGNVTVTGQAGPPCASTPQGVVAWWPGESNAWDVIGAFDGSFGPKPPPPGASLYTNGLVGTAFRFSPGQFVTVPASAALDLGKGDGFTFETWMNPERTSSLGIFGWGISQVRLQIGRSRVLEAYLVKALGQTILLQSVPATVEAAVWQHVALTCNITNGAAALYLNGARVAQTNMGPGALRTFGTFNLGSADGRGYFLGSLDEPSLYSRALSHAEIQSIYFAAAAGKCPPPPPDCKVAEADIAGWWRGESNTLDSVTINHGTMQPPGFPAQIGYSSGRYGAAFALRGANYVTVPASPLLDVGPGSGLTVEAWVNPSYTSYPIAEWNSGTGTQGVYLAYSVARGPGYLEANLVDEQGQSHVVLSPFIPPVFNQWRHVAMTHDRTTGSAALFVDGSVVTQTNLGSFTPRTTGNLYLGYRPPGNYPGSGSRFNGLMDEVTVYRRALSPSEIRCLKVAGDAGKYPPQTECLTPAPGMVAWWRGESNTLDSAQDNLGVLYARPSSGYTNGRVGLAFATGIREYMFVRSPHGLDVGKRPGLTVEAWINPALTASGSILGWSSPSGVSLSYNYGGPGNLRADLKDNVGVSHFLTSAPGLVNTGRWQHVALTYDRDSGWASMFVDGAVAAATHFGGLTPETSGNVLIGTGPASYFRGAVDEVAVYERALTPFEIATIYHSANGRCTEPPVVVRHPTSQRVNVGDDVSMTVEAVGNPILRYQWFREGYQFPKPTFLMDATNRWVTLTNVQNSSEGYYHVAVTNAFGSAISSNVLLLVNYPPVADASATRTPLILAPCTNELVAILDGSESSDPDGDLLDYQWFVPANNSAAATGVVAMLSLPAGAHTFDLLVDDGLLTDSNQVTVEVLTISQAIDRLVAAVNASSLKRMQRALLTLHLRLADTLLSRGNTVAGVVQLKGFIRKVDHFVEPDDAALAANWTAQANAIMDAVRSCWPGNSALEQLLVVVRASELPDPLRDKLEAYLITAIERANEHSEQAAAEYLESFISTTEAELRRADSELAAVLVDAARDIVDDTERGRMRPTAALAVNGVRMEFDGEEAQIYIIEASTDMVSWEMIGVAKHKGNGRFNFEDANADKFPWRFYRVVTP